MLFEDKGAIITGATSGIGWATAKQFAAEGASVLAVGRSRKALSELVKSVQQEPGYMAPCVADVTKPEAPERIVAAALEAFSGIDVLVNAAGIIGLGTLENTEDEAWDEMLDVNLRAPFRLMRAAAPHLAKRQGAIVNVSSVTGLRAFPGVLSYCVSKAGMDQLTRCAALELAPLGVRVNAVNPGVVVTNLHRRSGFSEQQYADFLEHSKTTHPLGRTGRPDEVADLVVFLASERAGWTTGETIAIDGGRHLTCAR